MFRPFKSCVKLLWLISMKSGTEGHETKVSFLQIMPKLDHGNKEAQIEQMWRSISANNPPAAYPGALTFHLCRMLFPMQDQASANRRIVTLPQFPVLFAAPTNLFCFPRVFSPFLASENGCCSDMSNPWAVGSCPAACTSMGQHSAPALQLPAVAVLLLQWGAVIKITALGKTSHTWWEMSSLQAAPLSE